jgi:hypothetical protein
VQKIIGDGMVQNRAVPPMIEVTLLAGVGIAKSRG